ncbi:MAG TPA: DNA-directed RNA polymerase subunit omega [Moorella mulderi]|nr:DNA-directed RNA polymerase subunit omega [Moorella mulderi]
MKQPSIDGLEKKVGSRYALAVMAAKRARMLREEDYIDLYHPRGTKPVTVALLEIAAGKIKFEWGKKK